MIEEIALQGLTILSNKIVSKFAGSGWNKAAQEIKLSCTIKDLKGFKRI